MTSQGGVSPDRKMAVLPMIHGTRLR